MIRCSLSALPRHWSNDIHLSTQVEVDASISPRKYETVAENTLLGFIHDPNHPKLLAHADRCPTQMWGSDFTSLLDNRTPARTRHLNRQWLTPSSPVRHLQSWMNGLMTGAMITTLLCVGSCLVLLDWRKCGSCTQCSHNTGRENLTLPD